MDLLKVLKDKNDKRIVLLVMDGLGGLPMERGGKTELEEAKTPNLDALAADAECGTLHPIDYGITPGSAPGHFCLFGYDPSAYEIGRGVIAAMGIAFPMKPGEVAARMNFATMDDEGKITDRRAGRISTEKNAELCKKLEGIKIEDIEIEVRPVKDHRACVVMKGPGISDRVNDTDPQETGVAPLKAEPREETKEAKKSARIANAFVQEVNSRLSGLQPANTCLLRGFASLPHIPSMKERFGLNPVCIAVYPDYKGVARLLDMKVIEGLHDLDEELAEVKKNWNNHDFFFIHHKKTDSTGEDGNFEEKVKEIEKVDAVIPQILDLKPDVLIVTGDHSTPAKMKAHSFHPVPFLIRAENQRLDDVKEFGERACNHGSLVNMPGIKLLSLAMAFAGKLKKFGA